MVYCKNFTAHKAQTHVFYQVSAVRGVFKGKAEAEREAGCAVELAGQHRDHHTRPATRENIRVRRARTANDQFR